MLPRWLLTQVLKRAVSPQKETGARGSAVQLGGLPLPRGRGVGGTGKNSGPFCISDKGNGTAQTVSILFIYKTTFHHLRSLCFKPLLRTPPHNLANIATTRIIMKENWVLSEQILFSNYVFPFLPCFLLLFSLPQPGTGQVLLGGAALGTQPDRERCPGARGSAPGSRAGRNEAGAAEVRQLQPSHGTPGTQSWLQELLLEDIHILLAFI